MPPNWKTEKTQDELNTGAIEALTITLAVLKEAKPGDRQELDRYYAIAITDMEKVLAFAEKYLK